MCAAALVSGSLTQAIIEVALQRLLELPYKILSKVQGVLRPISPELYRAAQSGSWGEIERFADELYSVQTAGGNTVLHVVAGQSSNSAEAVKRILKRAPSLRSVTNDEGETALHLAASMGHSYVVQAIIDFVKGMKFGLYRYVELKQLLGTVNRDGNTALHEAVRNNFYEAAKLLVELDPGFRYVANYVGESPLYLAVENENLDIAKLILTKCRSPCYDGPGCKTALHAAALCKLPERAELIQLMLEKSPELTKKVDEYGWTALHYAAKFNYQDMVSQLVSTDRTVAYVSASKDGWKTALHIAAIYGSLDVIRGILQSCPDCWERVTGERQNILHLAVKNERREVLEFILRSSWADHLINQKDVHGNTPLHLYVDTNELDGQNLMKHPRVSLNATNTAGLTPLGLIAESDKLTARQKEIKRQLEQAGVKSGFRNVTAKSEAKKIDKDKEKRLIKISDSYTIVATLIVTVTFAAGFTVPGGFESGNNQNQGMAVLVKKAAFFIFVAADSSALLFSMLVVLSQLAVHHWPKLLREPFGPLSSEAYIGYAMMAMVIAFLSGLFAVVPSSSIKIYLYVIVAVFGYCAVTTILDWGVMLWGGRSIFGPQARLARPQPFRLFQIGGGSHCLRR